MSSNDPYILDGINMHNPAVYFLNDHIGGYTDALLIINNIISVLKVSKFVILIFIPAEKHGRKKPLIQRSNVNQLSHQALQDGIKNSDSVHCEDNKTQDTCSHNMDTIQEAYAYHKSDRQKNFLMLVKSDNHGELNVKYQFLKADDIPKMAVVCKQPQIFEDKAVCFIDISDYEVPNYLNYYN